MADSTFIGSTLAVVAGAVPSALTEDGWEGAGTYVTVGNVQDIGEMGDTHSQIEYNVLAEGRVKRLPGTKDGGAIPITCVYDSVDAGQVLIRAANGTTTAQNFKVKDADGETYYFNGVVADLRWPTRDNSTVKMFSFNVYANTPVYGPFSDG